MRLTLPSPSVLSRLSPGVACTHALHGIARVMTVVLGLIRISYSAPLARHHAGPVPHGVPAPRGPHLARLVCGKQLKLTARQDARSPLLSSASSPDDVRDGLVGAEYAARHRPHRDKPASAFSADRSYGLRQIAHGGSAGRPHLRCHLRCRRRVDGRWTVRSKRQAKWHSVHSPPRIAGLGLH